jgi:hypothetical protein
VIPNFGDLSADTLVSITGVNFGAGDGDVQEIMIAGTPCTTTKQFISSTLVHSILKETGSG